MDITNQKIYFGDSRQMGVIPDNSIDLMVTSPPYPMIEMWDDVFAGSNETIRDRLNESSGNQAFELMHRILDKVWEEGNRVLKDQSFACINIGDATRKIGNNFKLYSNHARVIEKFRDLGFDALPVILWRKQTNAPNKFMGSGMLPAGAYVTLEHEYILIFRKGNKRDFKSREEKLKREQSSYFWEERNAWFSDVWDFKGIRQVLNNDKARQRSAAFPFELAFRLINMYSLKGETVLDPFVGTGTTLLAALTAKRNGIGMEIDPTLKEIITNNISGLGCQANAILARRLANHLSFIQEYSEKRGRAKYYNKVHKFPVVTKQELNLTIDFISEISIDNNTVSASYFCPMEDFNNLTTEIKLNQVRT
jgi:DNA modification methylase